MANKLNILDTIGNASFNNIIDKNVANFKYIQTNSCGIASGYNPSIDDIAFPGLTPGELFPLWPIIINAPFGTELNLQVIKVRVGESYVPALGDKIHFVLYDEQGQKFYEGSSNITGSGHRTGSNIFTITNNRAFLIAFIGTDQNNLVIADMAFTTVKNASTSFGLTASESGGFTAVSYSSNDLLIPTNGVTIPPWPDSITKLQSNAGIIGRIPPYIDLSYTI